MDATGELMTHCDEDNKHDRKVAALEQIDMLLIHIE